MRYFPDFISAYFDYAQDGFCPDIFHKWIGISICAAVLERKVSVDQGHNRHYPNLYVMLVSHPAVGKSTAINRGVDLIHALKKDHHSQLRTIPKSCTDAALIKEMEVIDYFQIGPGGNIHVPHSSGFFWADEASASALQNTCGNFVSTMTSFYDCPDKYDKATKGDGRSDIENICMNMLAGSTFNYLKELVNERSVLGGFASRLIYVVSKERKIRHTKWNFRDQKDYDMRNKLVADLHSIHKLAGPMRVSDEFIAKYEAWQPQFDEELIALKSEKLESIMGRKGTNLIKLAMVCSVSESNKMIVEGHHFDRAKELIDDVTKDNAMIISRSIMEQRDTQSGVNEALREFIREAGGAISTQDLRRAMFEFGTDVMMFDKALETALSSGLIVARKGLLSFVDDAE